MSIYIKGDIRCGVNGYKTMILMKDGTVTDTDGDIIGKAVEVPPHGRCIDADAFEAHVQNEWENNEISNGEWIQFREWFRDEQTIIPADREEEPT